MIHIFHTLLDSIFPPTKQQQLLRHHTPETFLQHYTPQSVDGHHAFSSYVNSTIRAAVTECKYQNNAHATALLGTLLRQWLITQEDRPTLLVPVPLSTKRERERGYNQVEHVCRQVTDVPHVTVAPRLLYRVRDTIPQTTLSRAKRLTNMQDAFAVKTSQLTQLHMVTNIIICDDVLTTGATLLAAKTALTPYIPTGCNVTCVCWSH